jgi:hypothetical protein
MALTKVEWQRPTQAVVVRRRPLGLNASPFDASAAEPSLLAPRALRGHTANQQDSLSIFGVRQSERERERGERREQRCGTPLDMESLETEHRSRAKQKKMPRLGFSVHFLKSIFHLSPRPITISSNSRTSSSPLLPFRPLPIATNRARCGSPLLPGEASSRGQGPASRRS